MMPGPTHIIKAPGCSKLLKLGTIASGNTFGATYWTDGKRDAPMLPDYPPLRKSSSEGVLFWLDDCEKIGEISFMRGDSGKPEWEDLGFAEHPTETDYFVAISSGIANTQERVKNLRIRLWWVGNDRIREKDASELSQQHFENLQELVTLLSEANDEERLMKAEALRELSHFNEALLLLEGNFPSNYDTAVARIRELTIASDNRVATLN